MPTFDNEKLNVHVEIVDIKQKHAVPYWQKLQEEEGASGPKQWAVILEAANQAKWFVEKIDPLDYTPAQARWLAEELALHLLEMSTVGEE